MNRNEALYIYSKKIMNDLCEQDKINILCDFWFIYEEENNFDEKLVILLMSNQPEDLDNYDEIYEPLLIEGLRRKFEILNNKYVGEKIKYEVFGDEINSKLKCPCCDFYSLYNWSEYEVCPICYWEDDGSKDNNYSSANKSTLKEYRVNFFEKNNFEDLEKKYIRQ